VVIYDPATTRPNPNGTGFVRDPFPGNIIPSDRISSISQKLQAALPGTTNGGLQNNYLGGNFPIGFNNDNITSKVDLNLSPAHRTSVLFSDGSRRQTTTSRPSRLISSREQARTPRPRKGVGMANKLKINVNGRVHTVSASPNTPLLYVLQGELHLHGPRFGCGLAQCGACSVLLGDAEIRSCVTPVSAVASANKEVTTVEGLPARWARQQGTAAEGAALHPVQEAWIAQQVPQCGYCQYGMMIKATELLEQNPTPSDDDIRAAFTTSGPSAHLCRCGSYAAILEGVRHAVTLLAKKDGSP